MTPPDKSYIVAFTQEEIRELLELIDVHQPLDDETTIVATRSKLLEAKEEPPVPVGVRLRVRDAFGREVVYAHRWDAVPRETAPGQKGMRISAGATGLDAEGVRGECEVHIGIYSPDGPPKFE